MFKEPHSTFIIKQTLTNCLSQYLLSPLMEKLIL